MTTLRATHQESQASVEFFMQSSSFQSFQNTLCSLLDLDPQGPFEVKYRDADGDWVSMSTDEELADALANPYLEVSVTKGKKALPKQKEKAAPILSAETQEAAKFVMSQNTQGADPLPSYAPPVKKEVPISSPAPAAAPIEAALAPAPSVSKPAAPPFSSSSPPSTSSLSSSSFHALRLAIRAAIVESFLPSSEGSLASETEETLITDALNLCQQLSTLGLPEPSNPLLSAAIFQGLSHASLSPSSTLTSLLEQAFPAPPQEQEEFRYTETDHTVLIDPTSASSAPAPSAPAPAPAALPQGEARPEDDFIVVDHSQEELQQPAEVAAPSEAAAPSAPSSSPPSASHPAPSRDIVDEFDPLSPATTSPPQPSFPLPLSPNNPFHPTSSSASEHTPIEVPSDLLNPQPPFHIDLPPQIYQQQPPAFPPSQVYQQAPPSQVYQQQPPPASQQPEILQGPSPAERFAKELRELKSMGFSGDERLLDALISFEGDLNTTIAFLLSEPGN